MPFMPVWPVPFKDRALVFTLSQSADSPRAAKVSCKMSTTSVVQSQVTPVSPDSRPVRGPLPPSSTASQCSVARRSVIAAATEPNEPLAASAVLQLGDAVAVLRGFVDGGLLVALAALELHVGAQPGPDPAEPTAEADPLPDRGRGGFVGVILGGVIFGSDWRAHRRRGASRRVLLRGVRQLMSEQRVALEGSRPPGCQRPARRFA